jgi:Fe-S cluster assembly protein SufD
VGERRGGLKICHEYALATRIADEYAAASAELPARVVSAARRELAVKALCAQGLPATRDENWRYANLRALERVRFAPPSAQPEEPRPKTPWPQLRCPLPIEGYVRHTYVDGVFAPELSSAARRAAAERRGARARARGRCALRAPQRRLCRRQRARAQRAQAPTPSCVEVLFVARAAGSRASSYPRLDVKVAAGARLNLIERHVSVGERRQLRQRRGRHRSGSGARVTHFRVQELGARATWIDTLNATVGADGSYQQHLVQLGALAARSTFHVRLAGARAAARLHALAAADAHQTHDAYALIEHAAPHTVSEQVFRGIAAGRARVAFNGKVTVCAGAPGTDSRQSLRGLLAGPEAEIDVRPQLEIHTDDVRCSHGATAGKLDERCSSICSRAALIRTRRSSF